MIAAIRAHPLAGFVALAYLGSWLAWSPWWLSQSGLGVLPYHPSFAAVAGINQAGLWVGPFAAALVVTRVSQGSGGVSRLLARCWQWRCHPGWYGLALGAIPVAAGVGYVLLRGPGGLREGDTLAAVGVLAGTFVVYLLGGPLQEEPGWRGVALPLLQDRLHPVSATLVLGLIHCLWHAPLFLTDEWDTARHEPSQFLAYLLLVVSWSFAMTWLYNGSGGSVLLAILGHNALNWAFVAAGTITSEATADTWPAALGSGGLALVVIAITRGRLGYARPTGSRGVPPPVSAPR